MKTPFFLIAILAFSGSAAAQVNKCVDATGKTVYSQGPCPKGAKASTVAVSKSAPPPAGKEGDASKASGPKSAAELEQEFRKRQQEQAEAQKKESDRLAAAKADQENCSAARRQLQSFELGGRQSTINDKGERTFMDDSQIAAEKSRAQQAVASFCK